MSWNRFHCIIAPRHDNPPASLKTRLVVTRAALNRVTPEYLANQREGLLRRYPHVNQSQRLKIGVLIGGDTRGVVFDENRMLSLMRQLKDAAQEYDAEILLTTSRRTSVAIDALIANALKGCERCVLCVIANAQNIPEAVGGILSVCDLLLVSGESISMVSEAVSSGKRTIVFNPQGEYHPHAANKYDRFVRDLRDEGFIQESSIDQVAQAIAVVLRQKVVLKAWDDRDIVRKHIEEVAR